MQKWIAFGLLLTASIKAEGQPVSGSTGGAQAGTSPAGNVKKASLEGVVTSASGEPLRKAEVRVFRTDARPQGSFAGGPGGTLVTTDDSGKFFAGDLEPGRYAISAQRTGYVTAGAGPARGRNTRARGMPVLLAEGQEMKGLEIRLFKQGVLSGRVVDEDGEPLQGGHVQLMQQRYVRGRRQMTPMQGGQVNDLGEYRVASLPPGKYYVSVNPQRMMRNEGAAPTDKPYDEGYTTMFYPNATEAAQAPLVEISPGAEITGIDFRMRKVRTFRIRGKVLDPNGQPARGVFLSAMPSGDIGFMQFRGGTSARGAEGTFELAGLTPGQYNLLAGRGNGGGRLSMAFPVTVGEQHVNDLVVQLAEPLTIKATARVEGKDAADLGGARLLFEAQTSAMPFMNNGAPWKEGVFEVTGVSPGRYRATLMGLPEGHYVKSVTVANQEAPNQVVDFSAGAAPLEIVLSDKAAQVTGTVQDAEGKPQAGVTIVLMSADSAKREGFDAYRTAQSDQTGSFSLKNIPPGEWVAYAFADAEDGAYQDPDWLKKYESSGSRLALKESGSEALVLKVLQ